MKANSIEDYYLIVYALGWVVVAVGIFLIVTAGLTGGDGNLGLSVVFAGLYVTVFVRNSQLKVRLMLLEKELEKK